MDQEPSWQRQLLVGLSVLLVIGLLIGAIVAFIAVRAADYVGIGGHVGSSTSSPQPILPTTGDATHTAGPPTDTPQSTTTTTTTHKPLPALTLAVSPKTVGSFDRINLSGRYPGHDGAALQVQRSLGDGPWEDFPVTPTTVTDGTYATYIQTSMLGANHLRMVDVVTGKTSNVVTVMIG